MSPVFPQNVCNPDPGSLPDFIGSVYAALKKAVEQGAEPPKVELIPAVPVKKSVTRDYIICRENGKKFKCHKRHIQTHYGLSPEEYRAKWGLPRDYPMVAPAYAAARSQLAKSMSLGRRSGTGTVSLAGPAAAQPVLPHFGFYPALTDRSLRTLRPKQYLIEYQVRQGSCGIFNCA